MTGTMVRFVLLGRLSPDEEDWEKEFTAPLMREALVRTVQEALARQKAELEVNVPSARWHREGRLVHRTEPGATPCWVWWVK